MKIDVYGHKQRYERWKEEVVKTGEEGLTKKNSDILIKYTFDMEVGANVSKSSQRGPRQPARLNNLRQRMAQIMRMLQDRGINDITKKDKDSMKKLEKVLTKMWSDMQNGNIKTKNGGAYKSVDTYQKVFKAFWNWFIKINKKEDIVLPNICEDWGVRKEEPKFVALSKSDLDKIVPYFTLDEQTIILFLFDSIIRAPTELMSLRVENITEKKGEVWVNVPDEVSKTFGRNFNLVFSGNAVEEYIKRNKLESQDNLFQFSPPLLNKKLQQVCKQVFGDKLSEGGDYYKNITLYDFRHSGAIHFRPLVKNVDKLRHRGGWTNLKMINYYTKFLNMTGQIEKEDLLVEEDKSKLEQEMNLMKKEFEAMQKQMAQLRRKTLEETAEKVTGKKVKITPRG